MAWLFGKFITLLRLKPGDILIVYDSKLIEELCRSSHISFPFHVPIINGCSFEGEEAHLFMKAMNFKELTAIYQIALTAHQEALCSQVSETL